MVDLRDALGSNEISQFLFAKEAGKATPGIGVGLGFDHFETVNGSGKDVHGSDHSMLRQAVSRAPLGSRFSLTCQQSACHRPFRLANLAEAV